MLLSRLGAAWGLAVAASLLFYPVLRAARPTRMAVFLLLAAGILATPLVVPPEARFLRALASVLAVTLVIRLWDLYVGVDRGSRPGMASFLAFIPNIFGLVYRKLDQLPRPSPGENLWRAAVGAAAFLLAASLFVVLMRLPWRDAGFAVEHTTKVIGFFLALVPLTLVLGALWRLAGGRGLEFMDNPFAARTPADFWRRYNRPVNQFLGENVFLPTGGRRHPVRATLAVFVVSAAVHEYVFSIAIGRVQGYQTAFFLLQGIAVAATLRAKPRGLAAAASVAATFAFNVASGVLFFASVNSVLPFYQNRPPLWDQPSDHRARAYMNGPACHRAYASKPGSDANGGRSNSRIESRSSVVGSSDMCATRWFGASQMTLSRKLSSPKHCA